MRRRAPYTRRVYILQQAYIKHLQSERKENDYFNSESAISRSVLGVEIVQFLWVCIDERMQKHANYLILRRRHTEKNEACIS